MVRNWRITPPTMAVEDGDHRIMPHQRCHNMYSGRFINKALLAPDGPNEYRKVCSINDVEDVKALLKLVPIWTTSLVYGVVFPESSTFYTEQGATLDRSITPSFNIPAASLQSIISLSVVLTMPIYDRVFVPTARAFTRKPAGITMLQRIGTGLFLSALSMVIAALVETKRLKIVEEYGLTDEPNVTIPTSVWWLLLQYTLIGVSETFAVVGLQEFFYNQVPTEIRSVGLSIYLSVFGLGNFLSSSLSSTLEKATDEDGRNNWFANNLNEAHLDCFYWLLVGITIVALIAYLHFSKSYIYNRETVLVTR